jgi:hypothetical protein
MGPEQTVRAWTAANVFSSAIAYRRWGGRSNVELGTSSYTAGAFHPHGARAGWSGALLQLAWNQRVACVRGPLRERSPTASGAGMLRLT